MPQINLTPAFARALGRCAMIGWEGAEPADLEITDEQSGELGDLIQSLIDTPDEAAV